MQEDTVNLDFVILPAPALIPDAARTYSEAISKHYLSNTMKDPIVLVCVVKATSDLGDNVSLKHIMDAGQLAKTIVVLLHSEEVTNSNSDEQILKRLLQTSRDMQMLETALARIATADFTSTDYNLDTAEDEEHRVFHHFVQDHINTLTCVGVSRWKVLHHHTLLSRSLTNEALVIQLANEMHEHIVQDWKPLSRTHLTPAVQSLMDNIHHLGDPVDCYTAQSILDAINNEVTLAEGTM